MLTSQVAGAFSYTMEITEQELQNRISEMMPLEKQKRFYSIVISDPIVNLISETNEIGLFANLDVTLLGNMKSTGQAEIKGSIDYDSEKGAFYLLNPQIINLNIDKLPKQYEPIIKQITQKALIKILAKNPVYKFKDDNIKHRLAKSVLESEQVKDQLLLIKLSTF
jgi:hypothetical protein